MDLAIQSISAGWRTRTARSNCLAPCLFTYYMLAFPRLSYGRSKTKMPAAMNNAPETYTGALVSRFANMATIGAMIPNTLFALAVIAFPVPRSFVANVSGVYAYSTAYMMLLIKLYAQFQPSSAPELSAVVEQNRNTPVRTVDAASVPLRPIRGVSTSSPPRRHPGTPSAAMISELRYVR